MLSIETKPQHKGNYRRRPEVVEAKMVTPETATEIADWVGATTLANGVRVPTTLAGLAFDLFAAPGMFVIKNLDGHREVLTSEEFHRRYDPLVPR